MTASRLGRNWIRVSIFATGFAFVVLAFAHAEEKSEVTCSGVDACVDDAAKNHDFGSVTDIIQAVCSVLSLGAVIWLFAVESRKQLKEKEQAHERDLLCFRIRSLVLESNLDVLHEFFLQNEEAFRAEAIKRAACINSVDLRKHIETEIGLFKNRYYTFAERLIDPLVVISAKFAALQDVANKAQDLATNHLAVASHSPAEIEKACSEMRRLRVEFLRVLFETEDAILRRISK